MPSRIKSPNFFCSIYLSWSAIISAMRERFFFGFNAFPCNGSGRLDSNQRSSGYEPDEIDPFSTPVDVALRSASHTSFPYLYPAFQSICSSGRGRCWWSGISTSQVPLQVCWEPFPTSTTNHGVYVATSYSRCSQTSAAHRLPLRHRRSADLYRLNEMIVPQSYFNFKAIHIYW